MTPDRWMALQSIFDRISDLPLEERERALKESCPDPEMERELRELFAELEQAQGWLEVPAPAAAALRRPDEERPRFEPGELIANRFRIIGLLGRGGMGEVYKCADQAAAGEQDLGARVALKTLRAALASDARALVRFRQELFHARQVTHPNVCRLHEIFVEKDAAGRPLLFFTMELLRGETLAELLAKGKPRIPTAEALRFATQIAAALDAAHAAGVIHRDIKPGNVVICGETPNRRAVITDFGLARTDTNQNESASRSVIGTLAYMAPEQLRGEVATRTADIYAFGLMAGEMLFGQRLADSVQPPPQSAEAVWAAAIRRATSPTPAARFPAAAEFVEALQAPPSRFPSLPSRRRVALGGAIAAVAAGGTAAGSWWWWSSLAGSRSRPKTVGLAVLPIDCTQPGQEHLQQAATNSLISHFRRLPEFEVPGPATVSSYAGKAQPARAIAKALKVDWLLMGAVEPNPGGQRRFVLSARLISADGSPGPWQDRLEGGFEELEKICARAASQAAAALSPALAQVNLPPGPTGQNAEAYDLYLRARYLWNRRQRNDLLEARRLAERAVELDPSFALGYCVLADTLSVLGDYGQLPPADVLPLAKQAALRAVSLNSEIADSHVSFAFTTFTNDFDWSAAQRSYARALEIDPYHSLAHQWYSTLLVRLDRPEDCLRHAREAIRLDAGSLPAHRNLLIMLYFLRRYPEAITQADYIFSIAPRYFGCLELKAEALARLGQRETALAAVKEMLKDSRTPGFSLAYVATTYAILGKAGETEETVRRLAGSEYGGNFQRGHVARAYSDLGQGDACFHWLEQAYSRRESGLQSLPFHHSFDRARSDPRFHQFLDRLRIVYPPKGFRAKNLACFPNFC